MSNQLRIEFDWLDCESGSEVDRAFAASIGVAVGEEYLTRLDDFGSKTVRNQVLASAWPLAVWFAANWWRLRWEPERPEWRNDPDWRMAHSMSAAGGGYVWPNAILASDGDEVKIVIKPRSKAAHFEPIRYINDIETSISVAEFEQKVDAFMEGILSRLQSLGLSDECLPGLWAEILMERRDSEVLQQRKLEAMAGFDPDQAPAGLIESLLADREKLGRNALAEMAAEARSDTGEVLEIIRELGQAHAKPKSGGFRAHVAGFPMSTTDETGRPTWQKAADLARQARAHWDLGRKPVRNGKLAEILGTKATIFSDGSTVATRMPLGIRTVKSDMFDIYFDRPNATTRRFAVSRLLGDHLNFVGPERLFPATQTKTSRQKFQRAFAQEFLCPMDALLEKIQTTQPNEDDIAEAAAHFHVSPLLVRTTLVNNGRLEREALNWAD